MRARELEGSGFALRLGGLIGRLTEFHRMYMQRPSAEAPGLFIIDKASKVVFIQTIKPTNEQMRKQREAL